MPLCDLTRIYDKSLVVPFYYCFKFNIDTTIFTLLGRSHHLLEPSPSVLSMHMYEIICTVQGNALLSLLAATAKSLQSCPTLCDPIDGSPPGSPRPWDSPGKNTGVGCHFLLQCMKVKSESEFTQSCPTLSDPMDCSLPGSSVHGIFQARVLEWVAIAFSLSLLTNTHFSDHLHMRMLLNVFRDSHSRVAENMASQVVQW